MSKQENMENTMDKKNNPFKVPENYFDNLNKRLEKEAKTKHVSVSRVLKYVASISLILTLSISIFIIGFNYDRKEPLLSFNVLNLFSSQNKETPQQNQQQNQYSEEIAWENQVKEMVKEAEQIEFTEEELAYMENYMEEEINEYIINNLETLE